MNKRDMPDRKTSLVQGTTFVNRFQLLQLLGIGAQGEVWSAHDLESGRDVALKVIEVDVDRIDDHTDTIKEWEKEKSIWAKLEGHQNVVTLYEVKHWTEEKANGSSAIYYCFIMEKAQETLATYLSNDLRNLDLKKKLQIMIGLAEGVNFAHTRDPKIIHKDIKPKNILVFGPLANQERFAISDFGIAVLDTDTGRRAQRWAGTPPYAAPEQLSSARSGADLTTAVDIYALGIVFLEILTGMSPRAVMKHDNRISETRINRIGRRQSKGVVKPPVFGPSLMRV